MEATLSELHRETRRIVRPVIHNGEEVVLTDLGRPVARIVPFLPKRVFDDPELMRDAALSDDAIMDAVRDARTEAGEGGTAP